MLAGLLLHVTTLLLHQTAAKCCHVATQCALAGGTQGSSSGQATAAAPTVGIDFIPLPMLDDFVSRVEQRPDGALSEEDILELCHAINAPELVKPLMELKQRQLRIASKAKK